MSDRPPVTEPGDGDRAVDPVAEPPVAAVDGPTRTSLLRLWAVAVVVFGVGVVALAVGLARWQDAERQREDLERDGRQESGLILTVEPAVPGIERATFAYDAGDDRQRTSFIVLNSYERGQRVVVFVDPDDLERATLAGETPQDGWAWLATLGALLVALVAIPVGARRLLRAARAWSVARLHPWSDWSMQGVYPQRRRLAVAAAGSPDEHLVRIDRWSSRRLGRLERKSPLLLAGSGRWFLVTAVDDRRILALGRMDVPYVRLGLVGSGAAPDRFDGQEPSAEVF